MTAQIRPAIRALAGALLLAGCGDFGRVNQGQVVEYQRRTGIITLVSDSNYRDPANPRFDVLPPVAVGIPEDPSEMGPDPEAGKLLLLDPAGGRALVFDSSLRSIRFIPISVLSEQSVALSASDANKYPVVDRAQKNITAYLPRQRRLVAFSVAGEYLALPDDTWKTGDEIRYYYRDPGRALRLMNVSKTDLNKAKE